MYLTANYRYSLFKLANTVRFYNLLNNEKESKKTFKVKDDCWFEFDSFIDNSLVFHELTIQVISEKKYIHQILKDYERAFIFLHKNKFVNGVEMTINEFLQCKISFRN